MIGASRIPKDIREIVVSMYHGCCGVHGCYSEATEIHHRVSNSKNNLAKYPLFLNSPINLIAICRKHHEDGKVLKALRWTEHQARIFEEYLTQLKEKG